MAIFRSRRPTLHARKLPRRTLAVVQNGPIFEPADGFAQIRVPAGADLHALRVKGWPDQPVGLLFRGCVANPPFTAGRFRRRFGLQPTVVPPLFRRGDYAAAGNGFLVSFVNRVTVKHVYLALQIARFCPQIPFALVLGWPLGLRKKARLEHQVALFPLSCFAIGRQTCAPADRDKRVLLVPSQWEAEIAGRLVTEAQFSGIPVVASERGGPREAVGLGVSSCPLGTCAGGAMPPRGTLYGIVRSDARSFPACRYRPGTTAHDADGYIVVPRCRLGLHVTRAEI